MTSILLITSDQQHFTTLGFDNPRIQTPALDRLAREGTVMDRAYCPNPVCSPSRSSIITGQYPSQHGCWTIGVKLPEETRTVGQLFSESGRDSWLIGKAHFQPLASTPDCPSIETYENARNLDFWRGFHGPFYGFDHIEITRNHADEFMVGQHYAIWMEEQGYKDWPKHYMKWPREKDDHHRYGAWQLPQEYHYTKWTADRTIAMLENAKKTGKNFLGWCSFHDPHPPYLVPEPWASMYKPADMQPGRVSPGEHDLNPPHFGMTQEKNPDFSALKETGHGLHGFSSHLRDYAKLQQDMAIYYGMVSFMDREIGRVLNALDRLGMADDTLVVFTTDHGHFLGQHGLIAKGAFHYEDMLRLPFLVRWPGQVAAGKRSNALVSLVDLAPTFLAAAGMPVPGFMQGVNQLPVWQGQKPSARDHVLVENRHEPTTIHLRTYINDRYKLTVYRGHPFGELFDLKEDPNELRNLWNSGGHAGIKAELLHRFVQAEISREATVMARVSGA